MTCPVQRLHFKSCNTRANGKCRRSRILVSPSPLLPFEFPQSESEMITTAPAAIALNLRHGRGARATIEFNRRRRIDFYLMHIGRRMRADELALTVG